MAPANWTTMNLSPAYLAEDNSAPLFATCIAFLVIDTFFIILLYTARSLTKEGKTKASMLTSLLMTGAYTVCVAKITVCFRTSCRASIPRSCISGY
jgi:drug/metabolite transporter (DMT)-like permease